MKEELTPVVFRVWVSEPPFECIALFPTIAGDIRGVFCAGYEHIGQHGAVDYDLCIRKTRPALPNEFRELLKELHNIGYGDLLLIKRATRKHHDARRNAAK